MEETPTGGTPPETEKPPENTETKTTEEVKAEATTDIPPVPPTPPAAPYSDRPLKKKDWMLFALIAVSVVAVLLLAATISLAVARCDGREGRYGHQMMNKRFFGNPGQGNQGMPRFRYAPGNQGQQSQPQVPQTTPSAPQLAPTPGQSP
jgi:hypothetical protein